MLAKVKPAIGRPKPGHVKGIFPLAAPPALADFGIMLIAWTTVSSRAEADAIAHTAIQQGRAACVQIDGPITSIYHWDGQVETTEEYRLTFKLLPEQAAALEQLVHKMHPYDTPEWIVVPASHVSEKYLSWARTTPNSSPF